MRRVKLNIASSLDGYIAGPNGSLDWLPQSGDFGLAAFYASIDTVLIGRKTHDGMKAAGQASYPGVKNFVFSRTNQGHAGGDFEYAPGDACAFVHSLRRAEGKDLRNHPIALRTERLN